MRCTLLLLTLVGLTSSIFAVPSPVGETVNAVVGGDATPALAIPPTKPGSRIGENPIPVQVIEHKDASFLDNVQGTWAGNLIARTAAVATKTVAGAASAALTVGAVGFGIAGYALQVFANVPMMMGIMFGTMWAAVGPALFILTAFIPFAWFPLLGITAFVHGLFYFGMIPMLIASVPLLYTAEILATVAQKADNVFQSADDYVKYLDFVKQRLNTITTVKQGADPEAEIKRIRAELGSKGRDIVINATEEWIKQNPKSVKDADKLRQSLAAINKEELDKKLNFALDKIAEQELKIAADKKKADGGKIVNW